MKKQYSAPDFIIVTVHDEDILTGSPTSISANNSTGDLSNGSNSLDWSNLFGA